MDSGSPQTSSGSPSLQKAPSQQVRLRLCMSYDGTSLYGWQKQAHGGDSVQGLLEKALGRLFNQKVSVVGSGRTDRGVHALNQWAHVDLKNPKDLSQLPYRLNRLTPPSLWIKKVEKAPETFHAQISAQSKCYTYRLLPGVPFNPFQRAYTYQPGREVNLKGLQKLAPIFLGEHDFSSFQSQGTFVKSPVRTLLGSRWVAKKSGILEYQVKGTGFLKQMVRNLVGTMLWLEQSKAPLEKAQEILQARDRRLAAPPAPAQGLFLSSVQYPEGLDSQCREL